MKPKSQISFKTVNQEQWVLRMEDNHPLLNTSCKLACLISLCTWCMLALLQQSTVNKWQQTTTEELHASQQSCLHFHPQNVTDRCDMSELGYATLWLLKRSNYSLHCWLVPHGCLCLFFLSLKKKIPLQCHSVWKETPCFILSGSHGHKVADNTRQCFKKKNLPCMLRIALPARIPHLSCATRKGDAWFYLATVNHGFSKLNNCITIFTQQTTAS